MLHFVGQVAARPLRSQPFARFLRMRFAAAKLVASSAQRTAVSNSPRASEISARSN
jgi:hypothetical protein